MGEVLAQYDTGVYGQVGRVVDVKDNIVVINCPEWEKVVSEKSDIVSKDQDFGVGSVIIFDVINQSADIPVIDQGRCRE